MVEQLKPFSDSSIREYVFFNDDTGRGRVWPEHVGTVVFLMRDGVRVSRHSLKRRPIAGVVVQVDGRLVVVRMGRHNR